MHKKILLQIYKETYRAYKRTLRLVKAYCPRCNDLGYCPGASSLGINYANVYLVASCLILCPFQTYRDRHKTAKEEFMFLNRKLIFRYY